MSNSKQLDWKVWALIGVAGAVTTYVVVKQVKKGVEQARENKSAYAIDKVNKKDPREAYASSYAQRLYAAFFRVGWSWIPDGTDEDAIFLVAQGMKDNKVPFSMVAKAYKNLYAQDLKDDLTSELDSSDLAKFYSILGVVGNLFSGLAAPSQTTTLQLI